MRTSIKILGSFTCALLSMCLMVAGCSVLQRNVAPTIVKSVKRYCAEPQDARLQIRNQINVLIAPNSVQLHCEGDTP